MPRRYTGGQVRHIRKQRLLVAKSKERKLALKQKMFPRPTPKQKNLFHIEDLMYRNGLYFVRPEHPDMIVGGSKEGIKLEESVTIRKQ